MEVECDVCKAIVDHTEVYYLEGYKDWHYTWPDMFVCQACQEKRRRDLVEATPERLLQLIRMCHPCEWGEPYTRYEVMEEIERRGADVLLGLGWPITKDSVYKNRFTADEETLGEMAGDQTEWTDRQHLPFEEWLCENNWSVMEHWTPKDKWTEEACFKEYLPKQTLKGWGFGNG